MASAPLGRWVGTAGAGPKSPERNQDRVAVVRAVGAVDVVGLVVCDGVGAYAGSGDVAQQAAEAASAHIARHGACTGILGSEDGSVEHCAQYAADLLGSREDGATTMLTLGADAAGRVAFSYLGNGMLLDAEPVTRGADRIRMSVAELTTPHISWTGGRPALRAVIPPLEGRRVTTARGLLWPQVDRPRVLLAVTDGIASDEERTEGVADGTRWRKVPEALAALLSALEGSWSQLVEDPEPGGALSATLQEALDGLPPGTLTDDATVGALMLVPTEG